MFAAGEITAPKMTIITRAPRGREDEARMQAKKELEEFKYYYLESHPTQFVLSTVGEFLGRSILMPFQILGSIFGAGCADSKARPLGDDETIIVEEEIEEVPEWQIDTPDEVPDHEDEIAADVDNLEQEDPLSGHLAASNPYWNHNFLISEELFVLSKIPKVSPFSDVDIIVENGAAQVYALMTYPNNQMLRCPKPNEGSEARSAAECHAVERSPLTDGNRFPEVGDTGEVHLRDHLDIGNNLSLITWSTLAGGHNGFAIVNRSTGQVMTRQMIPQVQISDGGAGQSIPVRGIQAAGVMRHGDKTTLMFAVRNQGISRTQPDKYGPGYLIAVDIAADGTLAQGAGIKMVFTQGYNPTAMLALNDHTIAVLNAGGDVAEPRSPNTPVEPSMVIIQNVNHDRPHSLPNYRVIHRVELPELMQEFPEMTLSSDVLRDGATRVSLYAASRGVPGKVYRVQFTEQGGVLAPDGIGSVELVGYNTPITGFATTPDHLTSVVVAGGTQIYFCGRNLSRGTLRLGDADIPASTLPFGNAPLANGAILYGNISGAGELIFFHAEGTAPGVTFTESPRIAHSRAFPQDMPACSDQSK